VTYFKMSFRLSDMGTRRKASVTVSSNSAGNLVSPEYKPKALQLNKAARSQDILS
jgi:hypothetical protein